MKNETVDNTALDGKIEFIGAEDSNGNVARKQLYGSSRSKNISDSDFEIIEIDNYYDNIIVGWVRDKITGKEYYASCSEECYAENQFISNFWMFYNLYEFTKDDRKFISKNNARWSKFWNDKNGDDNGSEDIRKEKQDFLKSKTPATYAFCVWGWNDDTINELWREACYEFVDDYRDPDDKSTKKEFKDKWEESLHMTEIPVTEIPDDHLTEIPDDHFWDGINDEKIKTKEEFFAMVRNFRKNLHEKGMIKIV